jgi:hypothetical protein
MKEFEAVLFDPAECLRETPGLRDWLAANTSLEERKDVLPFFKARQQLSAFLGSYHPDIARYDRVAHEFPLFGDFTCDLVVGDSQTQAYAFIEFEDAAPDSIFAKKGGKKKAGKATPEWAPRFERGFSQLVDWFFKLHDQANTTEFEAKFGSRTIKHCGLLVIGRDQALGPREAQRLRWRQEFVLVNSKQIHCKTFDQLCEELLYRLGKYSLAAKAEEKGTATDSGFVSPPPGGGK